MRIDSSLSLTSSQPITAGTGARDDFLRLFVAQLENQNPLEPQSGADMVAQLAQFSSVEQAMETNQRLGELIAAQDAAGAAGLANLVGREITADASTLTLDGPPPPLELSSSGRINAGELVIRDASGAEVRRIPFGPGSSPMPVPWDGNDARGVAVAPGSYSLEVVGTDGNTSAARVQMRGVVDALDLSELGSLLRIGGASVSPAAVTTIARAGATS